MVGCLDHRFPNAWAPKSSVLEPEALKFAILELLTRQALQVAMKLYLIFKT